MNDLCLVIADALTAFPADMQSDQFRDMFLLADGSVPGVCAIRLKLLFQFYVVWSL